MPYFLPCLGKEMEHNRTSRQAKLQTKVKERIKSRAQRQLGVGSTELAAWRVTAGRTWHAEKI